MGKDKRALYEQGFSATLKDDFHCEGTQTDLSFVFVLQSARNPRAESKRPSRKHRRRPSNLLQEYARRQRQRRHAWLETHIWHAKRFHMTDRWRFKLPLRANDKGARAVYRASAKHCLLQVNLARLSSQAHKFNHLSFGGSDVFTQQQMGHVSVVRVSSRIVQPAWTRGQVMESHA